MAMGTIQTDLSDTRILAINWAPLLTSGETISTAAWTLGSGLTYITDSVATGNLRTNVKFSTTAVGTWPATCTVTTSTGQTLQRTGYVQVLQL